MVAAQRVLVVDDLVASRSNVTSQLSRVPDVSVVGQTGSGAEALQLGFALSPDVVLLTLSLPDLDGVDVCRQLLAQQPALAVLVLSAKDDLPRLERALGAGAMGCLQRGFDLSTLRAALRAASRGESFLGPELDALLRPGAGEALTAREEEILGLIAEGFTSRQIGERLTLSPKTVENHRAHIKDKLSIRTTAGLVRHVLRQRERRAAPRLVPAPPPEKPAPAPAAAHPGRRASDATGQFGPEFQTELEQLFRWRRDVRRFKREPLPPGALELLMSQANLSPSVGLSQPWRFVRVSDPARRAKIVQNFERNNAAAQREYPDEKAQLYANLKLAGLKEAPEHLAVYADTGTSKGSGLGRRTMPEMLCYSAVTAVYTMWLAARARGWGMGWVSILNPVQVNMILEVPFGWELVAYLCLGLPEEEHLDPELQRHGWETRAPPVILER